jgi:aromatic ring-opening dioxygenase LigB subunit
MSQELTGPAIPFAVLMPHAPVLVPAVGGDRIGEVASSVAAMREAAQRLVGTKPRALVVVSPHSPRRPDAFGIWAGERCCGTFAAFGSPSTGVDLPADRHLVDAIVRETSARGIETWKIHQQELDHGAVVPLWFIVEAGWNGRTVVVSLNFPGQPGVAEFGGAIASAAAACGGRVALVASGDMSHRLTPFAPAGYEPRAMEFDHWLIDTIHRGDYRALRELEMLAGEDALDSVLLAAGATGFDATGHEVLSYEGPFGVGYGVAILHDTAAAPRTSTPNKEKLWLHH